MKVLVTGGAGFIGSHVVRRLVNKYPGYQIFNLDKLTYAGNLENLRDVQEAPNYQFLKADILERDALSKLFSQHQFDSIIHLAAESHVDRSIHSPLEFIQTNILGTVNLMECAMAAWADDLHNHLFYHISTDEVYGSLGETGLFTEETAYDPKSPYSASKASSDHFVRAYRNTYKLPVIISNCSNNYGPFQFPEKLIPLCINNIKHQKPLPIYGKGDNIRDWLYVVDHAKAIDEIFHKGTVGETYNIGGLNEWKNLDVVKLLCQLMDDKLGRPTGQSEELITFVKDRAGHDKRYAIDASKIEKELGWKPEVDFATGLSETVDWYLINEDWLEHVTSGAYQKYYDQHYGHGQVSS